MKKHRKSAYAIIHGGNGYPDISGRITFVQTGRGVLVTANISGLPGSENGIFAMHIHSGKSCTGTAEDEFANAGTHYNPGGAAHPYHAGDLPPLFSNGGFAYMQVLTDRFTVYDIISRVIIIHLNADDFTTQPSGNSGEKIACGKIVSA